MLRIAKSTWEVCGRSLLYSFNFFLYLELFFVKILGEIGKGKFLKQSFLTYVSWALGEEVDELQGPGSFEMYMSTFAGCVCVCVCVCVCFYPHYGERFIVCSSSSILKWIYDSPSSRLNTIASN